MVKTILVVEDDSYVREAALGILNNLGYQTHGAADGRVGLEAIETHSDVALLVCDVVPLFCRRSLFSLVKRLPFNVLLRLGFAGYRMPEPAVGR